MKTWLFLCRIIFIGWIFCIACYCGNSPSEIPGKIDSSSVERPIQAGINIDLLKVLDEKSLDRVSMVTVEYDHYFRSPKKYKGFSLVLLIDSVWKAAKLDTANAMIVFECRDGYNPVMELARIYGKTKGFIAFKDMDHRGQGNWPDTVGEQFKPYYLVWDHVKKSDQSFAWPYGLTAIRLISQEERLGLIYPSGDTSLQKGFAVFRDNCMKCHSINKIGGSVGPEFNIPKNITEYWDEKQIISFAKDPTSYRYNSHMPGMSRVSDKDFENIILYLKYMKDHKSIQ